MTDHDPGRDHWTHVPHLAPAFSHNLDRLGSPPPTLVGLSNELTTATATIERLNEEIHQLRHENERLRARLKTALRTRSNESVAATTLNKAAHITSAERYLDLVAQDLQYLAREQQRESHAVSSVRLLATQIQCLCQDLFIDQISNANNLCRRNGLDPIKHASTARDIIHKATEISGQTNAVHWRMHALSGHRLDPSYQEPWGPCDPEAEVAFVVAPAFVVDDRVYAKQLVFTTPKKRFWNRI